jgi:hypothetical protein
VTKTDKGKQSLQSRDLEETTSIKGRSWTGSSRAHEQHSNVEESMLPGTGLQKHVSQSTTYSRRPASLTTTDIQSSTELQHFLSGVRRLFELHDESQKLASRIEGKLNKRAALREKLSRAEAVVKDREGMNRSSSEDTVSNLGKRIDSLWEKIRPVEQDLGQLQTEQILLNRKTLALKTQLEQNAEKFETGKYLEKATTPHSGSPKSSSLFENEHDGFGSFIDELTGDREEHHAPTGAYGNLLLATRSEIDLMENTGEIIGVPEQHKLQADAHGIRPGDARIFLSHISAQFPSSFMDQEPRAAESDDILEFYEATPSMEEASVEETVSEPDISEKDIRLQSRAAKTQELIKTAARSIFRRLSCRAASRRVPGQNDKTNTST